MKQHVFRDTSGTFKLPDVAGDGSRHAILKSAAAFMRTVGCDSQEIYEHLRIFNRRCAGGGKPDAELLSLADYFAAKDVHQPMQALLEGWATQDADKARQHQRLKMPLQDTQKTLAGGQDFEGVLSQLQLGLAEVKPAAQPVEITSLSAAELDDGDFPLNSLIEDILVEGQPCIVAAPKKSLKTNTTIDMALSLASGSKFLGEFYGPKAVRVALISGESGKATIQETAWRTRGFTRVSEYQGCGCRMLAFPLEDGASMVHRLLESL